MAPPWRQSASSIRAYSVSAGTARRAAKSGAASNSLKLLPSAWPDRPAAESAANSGCGEKQPPDCPMARWNSPFASGDAYR